LNNIKLTKSVSVIVPTYKDGESLQYCIDALKRQSYPSNKLEVIIVNNDFNNKSLNLELPENFQIIDEFNPGSYAARNSGVKHAEGEILAFTDADCIPYPNWVQSAVETLMSGEDRIAGKIDLFFKSDDLSVAELYEKVYAFNQNKYAENGMGATANMITWRKNFEMVGYFNEDLMSGGDNEWGLRATKKGLTIKYSPNVIVKHPARDSIKDLLQKRKRVIGGEFIQSKPDDKTINITHILRGYMPPLKKNKELFENKDLGLSEKLLLSFVNYFFKAHRTTYKLSLRLGINKIERK